MHDHLQHRLVHSVFATMVEDGPLLGGLVDLNATGDKFSVVSPFPIDIVRFGFIADRAMDPDAGGFVLALDLRPIAHDNADAGRTQIDALTRADAQTIAAGTVVYRDVIVPVAEAAGDDTLSFGAGATAQTSRINVGPTGPLRVLPGQEAILEVTNAMGVAGLATLWVEYFELGFMTPPVTGVKLTRDTTGQ